MSGLLQSHGLSLPTLSAYTGVPLPESIGLYFIPIIPHLLTGLSFSTILQWIAPLFSVLTILLTFILTKQVFKDNKIALLAAFLLAVSVAAMSKTMAGEFRGDSFVSVFTLATLIFWIQATRAKSKLQMFLYTLFSTISLFLAVSIWSGGTYALIVVFLGVLLTGFVYLYKDLLKFKESRLVPYSMIFLVIIFIAASFWGQQSFSSMRPGLQETQAPP